MNNLHRCALCHTDQPRENFRTDKRRAHQTTGGIASWCNPCASIYTSAYRHNISVDEYLSGMASSDCCELCGSTHRLAFDQDHITKKFRGVLCLQCNTALGKFGDSIEGLQKAIDYLKRS